MRSVSSGVSIESRQERLRRRTVEEIRQRAFELLDAGGTNAVTISAVGKAVGMTPPALYRYFSSRDALVETLAEATYIDLGSAIEAAARHGGDQPATVQVDLMARAYIQWALAHRRRYAMLLLDRTTTDQDPPAGITAFNRGMQAMLLALDEVVATAPAAEATPLDAPLRRWSASLAAPPTTSLPALRLGVLLWSRLHGLVALEIAGAFHGMGLDVELLAAAEVEAVIQAARARS